MALTHLIKHIYANASDEVIRRGKKIQALGQVELIEHDDLMGSIHFRVKDDAYNTYYKVYITQFKDPSSMKLRCGCPYNLTEVCRHKGAALFQLQDLLDRNLLGERDMQYDQRHTLLKMKQLDLKMIRLFASKTTLEEAEEVLRSARANIIYARDERVQAELDVAGITYQVLIQKNEERNFDTSCNCQSETENPLCVHKTVVLLQLINSHGKDYFDSIRNWDKEKGKLLALYGYSLSDDLTGKFEFTYQDGKPFLRVLDPSIKRVGTVAREARFVPPPEETIVQDTTQEPTNIKLGYVIKYHNEQYPFVIIDAVQGEMNEEKNGFVGKIARIDLNKYVQTEVFDEDDKMRVQLLRKLLPSEVNRYLNKNSPFSGIWENIIQSNDETLPAETRQLIHEYLIPKWKKVQDETLESPFLFYLPSGKSFVTQNLQKASWGSEPIQPRFYVSMLEGEIPSYQVQCKLQVGNVEVEISENEAPVHFIFQWQNEIFLWRKPEDLFLIEPFIEKGYLDINQQNWPKFLHDFILPVAKEYSVQFMNVHKQEVKNMVPESSILLKERGEYLLFQPVFRYLSYQVRKGDPDKIIVPSEDKILLIHRNLEAEQAFLKKVENLHSQFIKTADSDVLALKGADALKNNWFFLFVDAIKDLQIQVEGLPTLKNFRFNTAKPSTKIYISSHTDWFDAKVEIHFGDQKVTVADVKKALANKQQYVPLSDGSLGILPEEWLRKYSLLFKVGEGKAQNIKLSKYHISVIEDLYDQRNEEELFFKLEEKYEKLKQLHTIRQIEPPEHLLPILRPYQTSGFQWLNYLREVEWGGILADDMGLGKTIQALSFLHHLKVQQGSIKALVVCPTTLMFNWQNEIKKFTPKLKYYTHHGGTRSQAQLLEEDAEVIITTYGTLRSDIKHFIEIQFDYVILDESQAIKNPNSKVTKAACLLQTRNRLCLSGTPLQNNTFDIFAQMNFLNPGMLGTMDHFKQEFAIPIDKFGEKEQKEHLRKILFPFILRRTKEQVARDLPEKQEMILYCDMGKEQRDIYDAFRNDFRDRILGVVDTQGIHKSQLTILQGLMKLRQICDSPAIMRDSEGDKYPNVSVKLEELGREITENISNHKALVFSQFLGMLSLIKEKMEELGIEYAYFDGSSSAAEREKEINRFQNNESCRVFLISLKAGGVGLNLTAADYVYIVDPWWNPAVEQQAIDRTHRIGQTKNIFAYRMICTDTVEDKIIQLQERKRALAKDLISDEEGFMKSLTREDVEYLFS